MDERTETIMRHDKDCARLRLLKPRIHRIGMDRKVSGRKTGRQWRLHRRDGNLAVHWPHNEVPHDCAR